MAKSVYLLYEADAWLSYDSMVLLGVFDSNEAMLEAVSTLARKELEKDPNHFRTFDEGDCPKTLSEEERDEIVESVIDEFTNNNLQTQAYSTNYYATEAELNHLDEDGIR